MDTHPSMAIRIRVHCCIMHCTTKHTGMHSYGPTCMPIYRKQVYTANEQMRSLHAQFWYGRVRVAQAQQYCITPMISYAVHACTVIPSGLC